MTDDSAAKALKARVWADFQMWLDQGIELSTCWVNPDTGNLEIGVRTPVAEATEPLRQRYGPGTKVNHEDVQAGW